ncbi:MULTISPECIES: hypothetical protein [unclassified Rhizobium]|uniref:hypothetical protein n=1 Tax=unclassified Rhizobium TaxID=2613769 RepID=UPI000EAA12E3|nr:MULTISPECIES: hypothetical protein [unclassified Rhizobium]AYG65176.1 hypothetical protein CCGE531_03615 [Rhizobium sp. CCGE531]AYG71660.1 hypothetical protein CCGE532_03610 [Rhizobium sp. CCGE532]
MSPLEFGAADSEDRDDRTHRAGARVIASLFVAFFAYIGLALGGGINLAARADADALSSGKDSRPLYLSLRDPVRGIVVADRLVTPKATWHDIGPAILAPLPSLGYLATPWQPRHPGDAARLEPLAFSAYFARGPPSDFA